MGYGQEGHGAQRPDRSAQGSDGRAGTEKQQEASAAPLLPRQNPEQKDGQDSAAAAQEVSADEERERVAQEQKDAVERSQALREQLREVLSSVWQASAAVVERALKVEDLPAADAANDATAAAAASPDPVVVAAGAAAPVEPAPLLNDSSAEMPQFESVSSESEAVAALQAAGAMAAPDLGPVQAYDAKGQGSRQQPTSGYLVDQRA
ncbi:hypothetical protein NBRC116584_30470 [Hydrogenophaga sp. 5NK40-0174]